MFIYPTNESIESLANDRRVTAGLATQWSDQQRWAARNYGAKADKDLIADTVQAVLMDAGFQDVIASLQPPAAADAGIEPPASLSPDAGRLDKIEYLLGQAVGTLSTVAAIVQKIVPRLERVEDALGAKVPGNLAISAFPPTGE